MKIVEAYKQGNRYTAFSNRLNVPRSIKKIYESIGRKCETEILQISRKYNLLSGNLGGK